MSKPKFKENGPAHKALLRAVKECRTLTGLHRQSGIPQPTLWRWVNELFRCGPEGVLKIEEATGGKVARHQLRPDLYPKPNKSQARQKPGVNKRGTSPPVTATAD